MTFTGLRFISSQIVYPLLLPPTEKNPKNFCKKMLSSSNLLLPNPRNQPLFTLHQQQRHVSFSCSRHHSIVKFKRNVIAAQNPATQQKITILNKRDEKLVGILNDTGSAKIVVLCHGFRASKESNMMVNLATALENEGISSFRLDFSGNGESEGPFQYGNYSGEVEDLRSVIEYFSGVNRSTFAILGHSKGGSVVLLYASKYRDVGAVVNVCGRYDLKSGIQRRLGENFLEVLKRDGYIDVKNKAGAVEYIVTKESMEERLNTDMHGACLSIDEKCRVLTVHGSADKTIPVQDALEFAKIIPNHQLEIIDGADHKFSSHQDELASVVLSFLKECLQNAAADVLK